MKKLITICLIMLTAFVGNSQTKEEKEYYKNGKLKSIGKTINGKLTGEWKSYYDNGQLKEFGFFNNDEQTGIWKTYFENGKLESIGKYIEDNEAGEWKIYDDTGKLVDTIKYFDGKQSDNIPPIQKYLDKVVSSDDYIDPNTVSQKISINTFILTFDSNHRKWKEVYSNIDWSKLRKYAYQEFKDYFVVEFYFYDKIKYEKIDKEFSNKNEEVDTFQCKIMPKDGKEVLEILKEWDDKRGD